jgi:hypothetical protein
MNPGTPKQPNSNSFYPERAELENIDRFISLSTAADLLGYASYISVNQLVSRKILPCYYLPITNRKRFLLSDIHNLLEKKAKPTGKKGRPRKF